MYKVNVPLTVECLNHTPNFQIIDFGLSDRQFCLANFAIRDIRLSGNISELAFMQHANGNAFHYHHQHAKKQAPFTLDCIQRLDSKKTLA